MTLTLKIVLYWILLDMLSYAVFKAHWLLSDSPLNYKAFYHHEWTGVVHYLISMVGIGAGLIYLFITFTEWWFGL